jgi:hypothetical protein
VAETLKASNLKWLCALTAVDIVILAPIVLAGVSGVEVTAWVMGRAASTLLLPVPVLIASALLSSDVKAMLVYWRLRHVLPGHAAFSRHGPADSRIDLDALRRRLGQLPTEPSEQNAAWYRLYQGVKSESAVIDANKGYLLYRDMAALSALSAVVVAVVLAVSGFDGALALVVLASLALQYLVTAIAARNSGTRLVRTVLAIYAANSDSAPRIHLPK